MLNHSVGHFLSNRRYSYYHSWFLKGVLNLTIHEQDVQEEDGTQERSLSCGHIQGHINVGKVTVLTYKICDAF